jgi:hypothetical protein
LEIRRLVGLANLDETRSGKKQLMGCRATSGRGKPLDGLEIGPSRSIFWHLGIVTENSLLCEWDRIRCGLPKNILNLPKLDEYMLTTPFPLLFSPQLIAGQPHYAKLFYLVRTGHAAEALDEALKAQRALDAHDPGFVSMFRTWVGAAHRRYV